MAFPAGDRGVIGVSNTDSADALATWSNYGEAVFLAAPGVDILTTSAAGGYSSITGTSASAASSPALPRFCAPPTPAASNGVIVGRLARNADPAGTAAQTGNGRINIARSLADVGVDAVQPAGAEPGSGGPFVGPYVTLAAAKQEVWRNLAPTTWISNTLSSSINDYGDGQAIPARFTLEKMAPNTAWSFTVQWDFSNSTVEHFIDSLTTYNTTEPATPCTNPTVDCTVGPNTFPIPVDPLLPPGAQIPGNLTVYNGSVTSMGAYSCLPVSCAPTAIRQVTVSGVSGSYSGNKDVSVLMGLHLARELEVGTVRMGQSRSPARRRSGTSAPVRAVIAATSRST